MVTIKRAKHRNEHDDEKRRQRFVLLFSVVIVVIMVFSILEVALYRNNSNNNQMKYGKYEFSYKDLGNGAGVLVTDVNNQEVEFQNLPTQVTYLTIDPHTIDVLKNAPVIVLTTNTLANQSLQDAANIDYARLQLGLALGFDKTANAMLQEDERYKLPIINCSRASAQMAVVVFNTSNETSVVSQGYCITINAEQRDLMRIKDRFIFEYYGILDKGVVVDS